MTLVPGAVWRPGPVGKKYWHTWMVSPVVNALEGVIVHSMDGPYSAALTVLDDESVTPQNSYRAASWCISVLLDGTKVQHYQLEDSPFHAGSPGPGSRLLGVEVEGRHSAALTEPQVVAVKEIIDFVAELKGWEPSRGEAFHNKTLWEHREVGNTKCPLERMVPYWGRWVTSPSVEPTITLYVDGLHTELGANGQYRSFYDVSVPDMDRDDPPLIAMSAPHKEWSPRGWVWRFDVDVDTSHIK